MLYAHASRILHLESNPGNARALRAATRRHRRVAEPAAHSAHRRKEMDCGVRAAYQRVPHPFYGRRADSGLQDDPLLRRDPARLLRRLHVLLHHRARGPHHPEPFRGLGAARDRDVRDTVPGFTGVDLRIWAARPRTCTAWPARARRSRAPAAGPSCVLPRRSARTSTPTTRRSIRLYRRARALPGIKKVLIASGVRYDLAIESPEYVKELAQHHTGGYLKIAPGGTAEAAAVEDDEAGVAAYDRFKELFDTLLEGGGQGAVPHPVLHRGASGHERPGHARSCAVAEAKRLARRPGAGLPARPDGDRRPPCTTRARTRSRRVTRTERGRAHSGRV